MDVGTYCFDDSLHQMGTTDFYEIFNAPGEVVMPIIEMVFFIIALVLIAWLVYELWIA